MTELCGIMLNIYGAFPHDAPYQPITEKLSYTEQNESERQRFLQKYVVGIVGNTL